MGKEMYRLVPIVALKPNPFRDMENYPIDENRIAALLESYDRTEFWGNIIARPDGDLKLEIAYGHHRLVALHRKYGERSKQNVGVIVRELSDADMIRIMADENDENWKSSAYVNMESVRAVLLAYAVGKLDGKLGKIPPRTDPKLICYAPSVVPGTRPPQSIGEVAFTRHMVATFLGWIRKNKDSSQPSFKCEVAFMCLEAVERGLAKEQDFIGIPITAAHTICSRALAESERKRREAEAIAKTAERKQKEAEKTTGRDRIRLEKEVEVLEQQATAAKKEAVQQPAQFIKEARKDIKAGAGLREIREKASARSDAAKPSRALKDWNEAVAKVVEKLRKQWTKDDPVHQSIQAIIEQSDGLTSSSLKTLSKELNNVVERVKKVVEDLG